MPNNYTQRITTFHRYLLQGKMIGFEKTSPQGPHVCFIDRAKQPAGTEVEINVEAPSSQIILITLASPRFPVALPSKSNASVGQVRRPLGAKILAQMERKRQSHASTS